MVRSSPRRGRRPLLERPCPAAPRARRATRRVPRARSARGSRLLAAADAVEILEPHADLAALRATLRVEHARVRELVDDARRAPVADPEPSLQERSRPT